MLRIAYHTLYKMCYIMYYITWHKIFHRFASQVLRLGRMVLARKAMKNCCLLLLSIVLFFTYVSRETLVLLASSGEIEVFASSGVWVAVPVSINPDNGRIETDFKFNAVPLGKPYDWFLTRSRGRQPIDNTFSFGAYIEKTYPNSPIQPVLISYRGKFYHDSGISVSSDGLTSGIVYPASTPGMSYQFEVPSPFNATPVSLKYPSGGYDNFGEDSFRSIAFFKRGTSEVLHYSRFHRFFVDDDGYTLPIDATDLRLYVKFVITMRANVMANSSDILDSVSTGFADTVDNLQSLEQSVNSGFANTVDNLQSLEQSVNSGFANTVDNLQSLEQSVNSGFTGVKQGIKDQTSTIVQNQDDNTQKILDQNSQFRQEDRQEAESVGQIAKQFLNTNTAKVKSNFNILWEPIAFTQRVISVFSGGTKSTTYARRYDGVVGFMYNEKTGCLDPIIDTGPRARYGKASSGTTITFPAYTLPVLNLKLWDAYTIDLSDVKDAFPVLFNSIYIFSGILCLYWFLGFLSQKFEEVFKE